MMSIFRKIKLALFSSGFILASYNASAMTEEREPLPRGLPITGQPLFEVFNDPALSSSPSPSIHQDVLNELSMRLALKGSEGESAIPSSSVPSTDTLNDSEEGMASSSLPEVSSFHKGKLEDIAGRLSPIGSALKNFLGSPPTSPQTKRESVGSSTSPREKRKSTKGRGRKNTLEISSPSPNNMTSTSIENYQEELPDLLREFSEKFKVVDYMSLSPRERQEQFYQLLSSFKDVEEIYKEINPEYCSSLEYIHDDLRNIIEVDNKRRFHLIRVATAPFIKEAVAEAAAARKAAEEAAAHQVVGEVGSEVDEIEGYKEDSLSSPFPSLPPLSPRGYGSLPPGLSKKDPILPTTPTSPPLSPRGNRSFPSSPPPMRPGLSNSESSSSVPLLLSLQQEGGSSPRPLPVPPSEKSPSSSISFSPPLHSSPPPLPHRSRSISTPVRKMEPDASSSPSSPPPNRRWAQYYKGPLIDLSNQPDQSD